MRSLCAGCGKKLDFSFNLYYPEESDIGECAVNC